MSEIKRMAVHPGYYLREYIEDVMLTQEEFAKRLGISGKQVSLILNEEASITLDIADKLSKLLGTSKEMWINLQNRYDMYVIEERNKEEYHKEKEIYRMIDKKFLYMLGIVDENDNIDEGKRKLRIESLVSSLTLHLNKDIYSSYRTALVKEENIKNIVCKNVWVSIASKLAKKEETNSFDEKKLISYIPLFRNMTLLSESEFYPKLKSMLSECGVSFVLLPSLKNSNINGVVKWISADRVMMALNTRGAFNDKFWFSFFHELKHVLQKHKRKMIIGEEGGNSIDEILEYEADEFAKNTLIDQNDFDSLKVYTRESILEFAKSINIHPGIVVGRLQKEEKIEYTHYNDLKVKYEVML